MTIAGLIVWPLAINPAQAADTLNDSPPLSECVSAATVLPLLGGAGDSPLVQAKFDGREGALFVTPQYSKFLIRNVSDDLWFVNDGPVTLIGLDWQLDRANWTHVERFGLGRLQFDEIRAVLIQPHLSKEVDGLPIVGVIGRDLLSDGLIELIDIPHGKLALYRWDHSRCGGAARLLGPDAHITSLSTENSFDGLVAGRHVKLHLDPDLAVNMFPLDQIEGIGIPRAYLKKLPSVILKFTTANHGYLSDPMTVELAGASLPKQKFLLAEHIDRITLGNSFFTRRTVMFDFRQHTLAFVDVQDPDPVGPTKHLHFDTSVISNATVRESTGTSALGAPSK
ncbi:hypothetical protein [Gluconacetobacter diazotrophicus]|uniref:Phytase-like domain-containing protein n=1 Tax=Gluconacetobacter diazotrophicus TaxID=33996 RepID=A0A7W4NPR7_GLUDI|nr:hypothetical protein [Gluconacetobacter diazotrophicus]MBB2158385.1 hypothetical protein [Gluconacetobacter diazotrophicus]